MLTRKDYRILANVIDRGITSMKGENQETVSPEVMVLKLCHMLRVQDEKFNTDKFLKACGL